MSKAALATGVSVLFASKTMLPSIISIFISGERKGQSVSQSNSREPYDPRVSNETKLAAVSGYDIPHCKENAPKVSEASVQKLRGDDPDRNPTNGNSVGPHQ